MARSGSEVEVSSNTRLGAFETGRDKGLARKSGKATGRIADLMVIGGE
jgi:hypothetical protein